MIEHDFNKYPELSNAQIEELQFSSPHVQITEDFWAVVVRVHDGDTVTLRCEFRDFDFPLRMADIDADELSEGGNTARDWLKSRLEDHEVRIIINPNNRVDKYGRLLGSILHNGMMVSDELLHLGLAKPFGAKNEGVVRDQFYYVPEVGV